MNARIFKKKCKQAMALLIAQHGFNKDNFSPCEQGETCSYVKKFVVRFPQHQRFHCWNVGTHYIRMAKGTPFYHWFDSYCGDGDAEPADDTLNNILFWNSPGADKLMDEI